MRTTLIIPDSLFARAKASARTHDKKLSELFAESVAERLNREEQAVREASGTYRVRPRPMGTPKADLADRDRLYAAMDDA
jgi:hypothetical protein